MVTELPDVNLKIDQKENLLIVRGFMLVVVAVGMWKTP